MIRDGNKGASALHHKATRTNEVPLPADATAIVLHPETRAIAGYKRKGVTIIGPAYTLIEAVEIAWLRVGLERKS